MDGAVIVPSAMASCFIASARIAAIIESIAGLAGAIPIAAWGSFVAVASEEVDIAAGASLVAPAPTIARPRASIAIEAVGIVRTAVTPGIFVWAFFVRCSDEWDGSE